MRMSGDKEVRAVKILYRAPVKFAVQPDCRPPVRYFSGETTVNPGGLQYNRIPCEAGKPAGTVSKVLG